jgi:soluble lytic murein transglycosylase
MPDSKWHHPMLKNAPILLAGGATAVLVVGAAWFALRLGQPPLKIPISNASKDPVTPSPQAEERSLGVIQQLALIPPELRSPYLQKLINTGKGMDRNRARLMWAADNIRNNQAQTALSALEGLEQDYPLLGAEVLVLKAKAQGLLGQTELANQTWMALIQRHGKDPAVVEALYGLGQQNPEYWNQALATFPAHPLSVAIALERLKTKPNDLALLKLVARHGFHLPDLKTYLKRLTDQHAAQLTPEDWHAIGLAYWEKLIYKEAGEAYARATPSALNLYRAARGLQLGGEIQNAIAAYQKLIQTFPESKETVQAYLKLGEILGPIEQRFSYLETGMQLAQKQGRSHLVADGLQTKAKLEQKLNKPQAQAATEQKLLTEHGSSGVAANLLWEHATTQAKAKNFAAARDSSWAIAQKAPKSNLAPKAAFWSGMWSKALGEPARQVEAFQFIWNQHPDSYYTWRSGSLSGWPVGDFKTVRSLTPTPNWPNQQLPLATGSETIQELYGMGQSTQAWKRWLVEFQTREQPSIPEQQTDGLIRIGIGEYLDGIFMLNNLDDRLEDEPAFEPQVRQWRSHPGFWYALYPLAYYPETAGWSETFKMNPFLALGLMRQESRFQAQIKSVVGAVGLMQIMPETGDYIGQKLGQKDFNLEIPNDNIRFGTWYLDEVHQTYGNNSILAIASYNAGPGKVAEWVEKNSGLPPDDFINAIPFDETRTYVTSVLENHWNYLRLYDPKYKNLVPNPFP